MHPQTARRVVVGVDGTPGTIAALRWAATEALRRDAELYAVHAWGSATRPASYAPVTGRSSPDESARRAAGRLAEAVRTAFGALPPVPVREVVDDRAAVPALLDHAREAELLVLATRAAGTGPSGPAGSGPGPTTLSCLRQAPCPVVVLPTVSDRVRSGGSRAAGAGTRWKFSGADGGHGAGQREG
jgi:nucleotide-binding universal stress UspA family protein